MTREEKSFRVAALLKYDRMLAIFLNSRYQLFLRCETALSIDRLFSKHFYFRREIDYVVANS